MRDDEDMNAFDLLVTHPTGRAVTTAIFVQVDRYWLPESSPDRKAICLSCECANALEFDSEVDRLISELQGLKKNARAAFARTALKAG